jgi:LysM repeat protein
MAGESEGEMQRHLTLLGMVFLLAAIVISNSQQPAATQPRSLAAPITVAPSIEPPTTIAIPPGGITHTVHTGETLYGISLQYSVSVDALAAANQLADSNTIYVGQTLLIPGASATEIAAAPVIPTAVEIAPPTELPSSPPVVALTPLPLDWPTLSPFDLGILTPRPTGAINGIVLDSIVVVPEGVAQNVQDIYRVGQALGRDPRSFSKLGDSTIENPHFLTRFDDGPYDLGQYGYLQSVIDYFRGSFARQGVAVHRGLHTWSVLDPMWADPYSCLSGEDMLACEIRLHNPSVVFIKLGSNDVGVPDSTERNLRRIVEYAISYGIIPVLSTKADRHEGAGNINNDIIRRVAADYQVPLLDFDLVAGTLPGRGLADDGVHLTSFFAHDWRSPVALQRGYGIHNLIALIMLDRVWQATQTGA